MLRFRCPPCLVILLRQIWEESIAHDRERKRDDAINDEQPSEAKLDLLQFEREARLTSNPRVRALH